tara:strand:+ start:9508 stop:11064 length:1557 start_codon:yes stop_codon:yes gene_type:complete
MAQTIQIRRGTGSAVPSSLADGELAINLDTGKFYYGSGSAVSSDFRVDSITAENYIVCSSVSNITTQTLSGSTAFGDSSDDTHQFTGDMRVTGLISASNNIFGAHLNLHGAGGDPTIHFGANDDRIYQTSNTIIIAPDDTDILTVSDQSVNNVKVEGNLKVTSHITASGNISASGLNHVFGGNVTIIKSGSDGDAVLTLEADSGNDNEAANPYIHLKQDNGGISGQIGISGDDDQWPSGHTLTGTKGNSMIIGMTGSASGNNRQLYLAAGNSASLRVENDADIHMYGNLNVAKAITVADTDVVDYDITNANKLTFGRANRDSIFTGTSFNVQTAITASGHISASGYLTADRLYLDASSGAYLQHSSGTTLSTNGALHAGQTISATGTILAGWHGSITRIKILVSDFIPDDIGRPAMIDDSGSDRWLESHGTAKLFASIPIPTGFKATHVHIYGSGTSALEVSEMNINSKTVTSKGTGNIGTELDITDVTSSTTNYLLLELAQASGEEVYGGYVTIEAV